MAAVIERITTPSKKLIAQAESRDVQAQHDLGRHYELAKDFVAAAKWYAKAAEAGHLLSKYFLARFYEHDQGIVQDLAKSKALFLEATEGGCVEAGNYTGLLYHDEMGAVTYYGREALQLKAESGDLKAAACLGMYYYLKEDDKAAEEWLSKVVKTEHSIYKRILASLYLFSKGKITRNIPLGIKLYIEAAEAGCTDSQAGLGYIYYDCEDLSFRDEAKAKEWLTKAAESGSLTAQYNLGSMLEKNRNFSQAIEWFTKASDMGHVSSQYALGLLFEEGVGVFEKNYARARECYAKAVAAGLHHASFRLAQFYWEGWGVSKDYSKAVELYTKAADEGFALAAFHLGVLYRDGADRFPKNILLEVKWLLKAALLGNEESKDIIRHLNTNSTVKHLSCVKDALKQLKAAESTKHRKEAAASAGEAETKKSADLDRILKERTREKEMAKASALAAEKAERLKAQALNASKKAERKSQIESKMEAEARAKAELPETIQKRRISLEQIKEEMIRNAAKRIEYQKDAWKDFSRSAAILRQNLTEPSKKRLTINKGRLPKLEENSRLLKEFYGFYLKVKESETTLLSEIEKLLRNSELDITMFIQGHQAVVKQIAELEARAKMIKMRADEHEQLLPDSNRRHEAVDKPVVDEATKLEIEIARQRDVESLVMVAAPSDLKVEHEEATARTVTRVAGAAPAGVVEAPKSSDAGTCSLGHRSPIKLKAKDARTRKPKKAGKIDDKMIERVERKGTSDFDSRLADLDRLNRRLERALGRAPKSMPEISVTFTGVGRKSERQMTYEAMRDSEAIWFLMGSGKSQGEALAIEEPMPLVELAAHRPNLLDSDRPAMPPSVKDDGALRYERSPLFKSELDRIRQVIRVLEQAVESGDRAWDRTKQNALLGSFARLNAVVSKEHTTPVGRVARRLRNAIFKLQKETIFEVGEGGQVDLLRIAFHWVIFLETDAFLRRFVTEEEVLEAVKLSQLTRIFTLGKSLDIDAKGSEKKFWNNISSRIDVPKCVTRIKLTHLDLMAEWRKEAVPGIEGVLTEAAIHYCEGVLGSDLVALVEARSRGNSAAKIALKDFKELLIFFKEIRDRGVFARHPYLEPVMNLLSLEVEDKTGEPAAPRRPTRAGF